MTTDAITITARAIAERTNAEREYSLCIPFMGVDTRGIDVNLEFRAEVEVNGPKLLFEETILHHISEAARMVLHSGLDRQPWRLAGYRDSVADNCADNMLHALLSLLNNRKIRFKHIVVHHKGIS